MDNITCGRCRVSQIAQFRRCIFSQNIDLFRHLELEIGSAIPASIDGKYNWNNSAGQGLTLTMLTYSCLKHGEQRGLKSSKNVLALSASFQ